MSVRPNQSRLSRLAFQSFCLRCQPQNASTRPAQPWLNLPLQRSFSTARSLKDAQVAYNHYEVLGMQPGASKAELKRAFYKLSKETHPDLHKDDPTASQRFSQISESYSVLGNDEKRRRYDRDFMRQNQPSPDRPGTYAGSRPASGLSKRRGTFRGAPTSFYAQGSYGSSGRQAPNAQEQAERQGGTFNASAYTERGRCDPEFNPDPVFRTQTVEDVKRARRMQATIDMDAIERDRNDTFLLRFIVVTTIVVAGVTAGTVLVSMKSAPRGGTTRADGSRRDGPRNDWAKG